MLYTNMLMNSQDSNKECSRDVEQNALKIKLRAVLFTLINGKLGIVINENHRDKNKVSLYREYSIHHVDDIGIYRGFEGLVAESIRNNINNISLCFIHQVGINSRDNLSINYGILSRRSNTRVTDRHSLFTISLNLVYRSDERKIEKLYIETEDHSRYMTCNIITEIDKHNGEWRPKRAIYLNKDSSNIILSMEDIQAVYDAVKYLKDQADKTSYIYNLLETEFSIGDAQKLYESVICKSCISCNYRKKFLDSKMFISTGNSREYRGREVALYKINKYSIIDYLG